MTLRFPGGESDETRWQEEVVAHLRLDDWERVRLDDIDLVGPVAATVLRRHGILWPANAHFHVPMLARAAGGSLLTGIDGDVLFGGWRWARPGPHPSARSQVSSAAQYGAHVTFSALPQGARAIVARGAFSRPAWIHDPGWREVARYLASVWELEPRRWDSRVAWWSRRRYLACGVSSLSLLAADEGVHVVHPLLDPGFLAALAAAGGRRGFQSRTEVMRVLFGHLLPDAILSREDKATFDTAIWAEHSRAFIRGWDGEGVDDSLVDVASLRREWDRPVPHFQTAMLLQAAWLHASCPQDAADARAASRPTSRPTPDHLRVVRSLMLDRAGAAAVDRLRDAGIASILLKGPSIAGWLYHDGEIRTYDDIDLLVSPEQFEGAKEALAALGYSHRLEGAHPVEFGPLEEELIGPSGACIDLHHGLVGTAAPAQQCWELLLGHAVPFRLAGGAEVAVLDIPARALHLGLHAAQGGPADQKALADLERGLDQLGAAVWQEAASLAEELRATQALAAGLRLSPAGARLADRLSLPYGMTTELALRASSARRHALFVERLSAEPGLAPKATLVLRKLFPTPVLLRANSRLAGRGRAGLLFARLSHPFAVAARSVPAVFAWRRARRAAINDSRPAAGDRPPLGW